MKEKAIKSSRKKNSKVCDDLNDDKKWRYDRNVNRALKSAERVINTNYSLFYDTSKFFTLTFKNDENDNSPTRELVKKNRISFAEGGKEYVIAFNAPYMKEKDLQNLWGNNFVKIKKVHIDDLRRYSTKYITKLFAKSER